MNHKPLFLTVALIALLVVVGAFWFMKQRQGAMNQPIVTEPVAQDPIQTEAEKYPQHIEAIPGNTDEVWYNIPELGIRMKLNKEFAEDLVYAYSKSDEELTKEEQKYTLPFHERVDFSSYSLIVKESACKPGSRAIGEIIKESGDVKDWSVVDGYFDSRIQLPNFFVVFGIPVGQDNPNTPMCYLSDGSRWSLSKISESEKKKIEEIVENQSVTLKNSFSSSEEIL
jgi:hypothetical protein